MKQLTNGAVYKIGESLYKNVDKNSGLHEYNIVAHALSKLDLQNTLVIINGRYTDGDKSNLSNLLSKYNKKIFVCSDAIAFKDNIDIINECDALLHQCPFSKIENVSNRIKQHYSYVPELFYVPFAKPTVQDDLLFYGGGLRNSNTLDYLKAVPSKDLLKHGKFDNRLPYYDYIDEAKNHKFALIVSRQEYIDLGWVTSRFVEAASCWNYPITDIDYDRFQYFGMTKVLNATDVRNTIDKLSKDESTRLTKIKFYRHRFENDSLKFKALMEELINE